jgi:hypothetical protein
MEWIASTLYTTSEHGVSSITAADAYTSAASRRLNWSPRRFKWTPPFRRKMKSGSCTCAITFQLASSNSISEQLRSTLVPLVYTTRHQYWVWVQMLISDQIDVLAALTLGKETLYSLHRRLGGRQSRSGHCGGGISLSIDWEPNSDSIVVHFVVLLLYLSGCLGCSTLYEGW